MDTVNELKELKRRAEEMKNDSTVCIPIENVYDLVMEYEQKSSFK